MSKLWGALFFIVGIILFVLALIIVFPLPDYMRIPLVLAILAIVAIEALTNWGTFVRKAYVFGVSFAILSFMFVILLIYVGVAEVTKPLLLFIIAGIMLAIGSYILKRIINY